MLSVACFLEKSSNRLGDYCFLITNAGIHGRDTQNTNRVSSTIREKDKSHTQT